jgi:EmrB/QacA subfamily drug resistance transporter
MTAQQLQSFYDNNARARWLALLSVCLAIFITSVSMSAASIAIPSIARDLEASARAVSWIPTSFLWGNIVLLLPAGRLADTLGRKRLYILGVTLFALFSLCIFLVDDINALLSLRVFQGFSVALVTATSMGIIGAVFANSNRGAALGLTSSSVYLGLSCGPIIGGWLTQEFGWRAVFWMPAPVMLIALLLIFSFVKGEWKSAKPEPLDKIGSLLFAAWVSAFFIGMSDVEDVSHLVLLATGIGLLFLFVKQQGNAASPLIRIRALRENRIFSRSILSSFLMYSANFPIVFLMSLYLQYIHGLSPLEAGQLVLIQTFIMMVLAPIAGRLSDRYEPRYLATSGCLSFATGLAILFWVDMDTSLTYVFMGLVFLGIGFGLFSSPNNNAIIGSASKDRLSIASALVGLSRNMGNMFSTAIVMMLMSIMLGNQSIGPDNLDQLLWVIKVVFVLTLISALCASYYSFTRGQIHQK